MKKEKNKNVFGLDSRSSTAPMVHASKAQLMADRKAILAASANPLLKKNIEIALDDDHPGQMSAMKMCMERLLPMSEFEAKKDGSRTAITISITGVGESPVIEGSKDDIEEV